MRVALAFAVLTACSGLGVPRQPFERTDEGPELGQTDRSMSRASPRSTALGSRLDEATKVATAAREAAEAAEKRVLEQIGSNISEKQLAANDLRAAAEESSEYKREAKVRGVVDSMDRLASLEDRDVDNLIRQSHMDFTRKRAISERKVAMEEQDEQKAEAADRAEDERNMRRSAKSLDTSQRQASHDKSVAAKELKEVDKKLAEARAQKRKSMKMLEAAEAETSARLWKEAEDLRATADTGTLPEGEVLRLLDVTQETLDNLTGTLSNISGRSDRGAWFEERVEILRSRSAAASAHLVEAVQYKAREFVQQHQDYNDRQFVALLARLLNSTKNEIGLLQKTSDGISERMQGFEQTNPENFTSALALAIGGVTRNVEFRNNLLHVDSNRLSHSSVAEACDQLSSMFASNMQPAYRSLGHMKEALDNITKVVPSIAGDKPSIRKMLKNRTLNLLNMAYMEHLAYKECATTLMTEVSPVIMERLHCSFSSSFVHASLNRAAAALAAFASWLAL